MKGIEESEYRSKNRNTTYYSLKAFVLMILADNKEDFIKYYRLASHDNAGGGTWYYIEKYKDYDRKEIEREMAK